MDTDGDGGAQSAHGGQWTVARGARWTVACRHAQWTVALCVGWTVGGLTVAYRLRHAIYLGTEGEEDDTVTDAR